MILSNPGAGPCEDGTYNNAYDNIQAFIKDCEVPMIIVSSEHKPKDNGRFLFKLECFLFPDYKVEVEMPGLPLKEVRWFSPDDGDIFNFPRLYIDGSSWIWNCAIITRDSIIQFLEEKAHDADMTSKLCRSGIDFLKRAQSDANGYYKKGQTDNE